MLTDYAKAAGLLTASEDIAILCHRSPDGDTLGCGYALCLALLGLGKRARVLCSDPLPRRYQYLAQGVPPLDFSPQFVVAVDVADAALLGGLSSYGDRVDLCIDHHPSNTGYAKSLLLEGDSAAACEILFLLLGEMGAAITPAIAGCLYTGMATDTGCFRYSNTTARTHRIAAQLMELGADVGAINKWLFETKTKASMELKRLAEGTLEYHFGGRCAFITVTQEMLQKSGALEEDLEGVSSIPRRVEGVVAGAAFREQPDGIWRLSLRTGEPIDASEVCRRMGGGGHSRAAGCTLRCPLEQAKQTVLEALSHDL